MSIPLKRNQVLGLEQLDERLDVPVSRFSATVQKLVRTFRTKDLGLRIAWPGPVSGGSAFGGALDTGRRKKPTPRGRCAPDAECSFKPVTTSDRLFLVSTHL